MKNLIEAVLKVMSEVKGMEKNSKVGTGGSSYNGTKYQDVAEVFNDAMSRNGLVMMPIDIDESTQIDRWEEEQIWSGKTQIKQKQSVFTKVKTKYLLCHESGETQELCGYGHGVDAQDKGAGKALTYAYKNTLLYTFLTPVGKMDDTETTHSDDIATPQQPQVSTAEMLKTSTAEMLKAKTKEEATAIWNKYQPLQKNLEFIRVTKKQGETISNGAK